MHSLHVFPYQNSSENEHWVDSVDLLPLDVQIKIKEILSAGGGFVDRGDRLEISRAPTVREFELLSALCEKSGIQFLAQIRSEQVWHDEVTRMTPREGRRSVR